MQMVSAGTAAISMEEPVAPATTVPTPSVVEKEPTVLPEIAATPEKTAPAAEAPIRVPAEMAWRLSASEVEQIAEQVAWTVGRKGTRGHHPGTGAQPLTREIAVQTARAASPRIWAGEPHTRRCAPRREAAKTGCHRNRQRGTAERTARTHRAGKRPGPWPNRPRREVSELVFPSAQCRPRQLGQPGRIAQGDRGPGRPAQPGDADFGHRQNQSSSSRSFRWFAAAFSRSSKPLPGKPRSVRSDKPPSI